MAFFTYFFVSFQESNRNKNRQRQKRQITKTKSTTHHSTNLFSTSSFQLGCCLSWWSPSWLNLAPTERPQMLVNFLPELSNASRRLGGNQALAAGRSAGWLQVRPSSTLAATGTTWINAPWPASVRTPAGCRAVEEVGKAMFGVFFCDQAC